MASVDVAKLSAIIGATYEAALDETRWAGLLADICDLFDGSRACFIQFDGVQFSASASVHDPALDTPDAIEAFLRDPLSTMLEKASVGEIYRPGQFIERSAFLRSELWQDWFRQRDMYDGLSCKLMAQGPTRWLFDVQRSSRQAEFDAPEINLLSLIVPHLVRAGEISRQVWQAKLRSSVFTGLPFGIVVAAGDGRIVDMNDAAAAILEGQNGALRSRSGFLTAGNEQDTRSLLRMLDACCSGTGNGLPSTGGALVLAGDPTRETPRGLMLSIAPFAGPDTYGFPAGRYAMVLLRDALPSLTEDIEDRLRMAFDLTRAEARIALLIAAGLSPKQAAAKEGVTFNTVRTYLIRVYRKTGANSQSRLVSLVRDLQSMPLSRRFLEGGRDFMLP